MSRLGRNPFDKKSVRAIDIVREEPKAQEPQSLRDLLGHLTVNLRAESYVFGLKIYLLALALTE